MVLDELEQCHQCPLQSVTWWPHHPAWMVVAVAAEPRPVSASAPAGEVRGATREKTYQLVAPSAVAAACNGDEKPIDTAPRVPGRVSRDLTQVMRAGEAHPSAH
eukprot:scaffold17242_cov126-Isochrysis_galbana.AAC.10